MDGYRKLWLVAALVLLWGCDEDSRRITAPAGITAHSSEIVGEWTNEDPQTRGITRVSIRIDGSRFYVHMWGACHPSDCDWGETVGRVADYEADGELDLIWDQGFVVRDQQLVLLEDGRLRLISHSDYRDSRPDANWVYYFVRVEEATEE